MKMTATFSPCKQYRYSLWRIWGQASPFVNFICLNPSTADETKDDNTIRKCIKFARSWGYDSLCVTNIFAWRSTDPEAMKKVQYPVGAENDLYLAEVAKEAALVVAAWSQHGSFLGRSTDIRNLLPSKLHILRMGKGKNPEPWHPLYLPDATKPILWTHSTA